MIHVAHPPGYDAERRYVADLVLGELLGLDVEHAEAGAGDTELTIAGHDGSLRLPDVFFRTPADDWLTERSLPCEPFELVDGVPAPFAGDLLGAAFFLVTRYEEAVVSQRDEHGRFPAAASCTASRLDRPLVNEYAEILWERLVATWPRLQQDRGRRARVLPSHDVDIPFCGGRSAIARLRNAAGDVAKRRDPALALRRLAGVGDPCDTFDFLMDTSERAGVRSAFFFIAAHGPEDRIGNGYSLDDPRIRALLRRIHERGHEIGLHGSYKTLDQPALLAGELAALRSACAGEGIEQEEWGGRQHFLRWAPPLWRAYEEHGLSYDTSVAYAEAPGFRAGICTEYPVFDLHERRRLRLRERPLVAMEVSLLQYLELDDDAALRSLTALRETCRRFDGDFTLLWHNDRLSRRGARRIYEEALTG